MNRNRDEDDDENGRRGMSIWLIGPCCCFGLAALIWLIFLQVQANHIEHRLDLLIRDCAGTCGAGVGTVLASAHAGVKAASFAKSSSAPTKKARGAAPLVDHHHQKHAAKAAKAALKADEELPFDAAGGVGAARWTRVGDAKKPPPIKVQ